MKTFASLLQFQKHFDTNEKCRAYLEQQRWGNTPACPFCGSTNVCRFKNDSRKFKCREKECRKKFSVTVGTIYENTKIPLTKWFLATYILTNHSKGISSHQLAAWLGITQKSAWFLNHRIREMLTDKSPKLLEGMVEVDESWVGGKFSNIHKSKKKGKNHNDNKTIVFGALQRGGKVVTKIVPDTKAVTLVDAVHSTVKGGSIMVSDENSAYKSLSKTFVHGSVHHGIGEYVNGPIHTNGIEGFWSILKRQINGIHHCVSPKHLQRYCNEAGFRYNLRTNAQDEKFTTSIQNCEGRLKYSVLINKPKRK
ncbi:MAG: IS1595 family transposase [Flavobacteriales bacterium]|nr:IS1595 family transposase [Flavobacteriales bacterium]